MKALILLGVAAGCFLIAICCIWLARLLDQPRIRHRHGAGWSHGFGWAGFGSVLTMVGTLCAAVVAAFMEDA